LQHWQRKQQKRLQKHREERNPDLPAIRPQKRRLKLGQAASEGGRN